MCVRLRKYFFFRVDNAVVAITGFTAATSYDKCKNYR